MLFRRRSCAAALTPRWQTGPRPRVITTRGLHKDRCYNGCCLPAASRSASPAAP
ncbi:MAG: hypothetical protein AVDCRST_MAG88-1329 [uncultured Thermomicrobiales bacterium]|uniref:Uncharacterized protein n=1 Tax=uncultured Thermomicrobiales bacterium TaxID=1645740 RepID=A0A6J4US11_9BACT|nr:MAG: hypothetical protein AVDCRST_MAG88-1329 [uncultured Thermomicrobiales bacterium]